MAATTPTAVPTSPVTKPRRRFWQFSLRTLMVAMLVLGVLFGLFAIRLQRARRQAAAVATIQKLGWSVAYDYWYEADQYLIEKPGGHKSPVPWPLIALLGRDFFHAPAACWHPIYNQQPSSPEEVRAFWQAIERLPKLRKIQAQHQWVDGRTTTESLRDHSQLQSLMLSEGTLRGADLEPLAGLERLEWLHLTFNQIDEAGAHHLAAVPNLKSLVVSHNQLGDRGARELAQSRSITRLEIGVNALSAEGSAHIAKMAQLEHLDLGAPVNDEVLAQLGKLSNLEHLHLGSGASDRGLADISRLAKLRDLSISGDDITDAGMTHLAALTELTALSLSGKGITDEGLVTIGKLHKLQRLNLQGKFTDDGLANLASLTELQLLAIRDAPLDGTGFVHLAGLTKLEYLSINKCQVNDAGLICILQMPRLKTLDLSCSPLTGQQLAASSLPPGIGFNVLTLVDTGLDDEGLMGLSRIPCTNLVIFGSKVTPEGLKRFRKANPAVTVIGP